MNAVFTIVAKNYLPLAFVQAETLKKFHPDIAYSILLADSTEGLDLDSIPYDIQELDVLDISDIETLEFKYNLTEFCTSVKPYYINHLFRSGYKNVIYLDPDVCVFSSLDPIFQELTTKSIVVTPHFITPEVKYTGTITEALLLHVGVFNFGFVAVAKTERGQHFINWWENRLHDLAYQDKIEALHTDQKWADLLPAFYGDDLVISADIGRNMAFWNLHERKLIYDEGGSHQVENRFNKVRMPLMLFHFAGYDIENPDKIIHKHHLEYPMTYFPELKPLFLWYKEMLFANQYQEFIKLPYQFDKFDNGGRISLFQRRIFRTLIERGIKFDKPFSVGKSSYYMLLKKNNLLSSGKTDKYKNKDVASFSKKISLINWVMNNVKNIIGLDNYSLLSRFGMRYLRPENQFFLLKEYRNHYEFKNENVKANH